MARISLDPPRTLLNRAVEWYSRRVYGTVLDPVRAGTHNRRVLLSTLRLEFGVAKWKELDESLKALAVMATSAAIGCSWCLDFGYWENRRHGMDAEKLHDVPRWRESSVFTPLERDVMEYAEAMTLTPPTVDDDLVARLRKHLDEAALVELTAMIALENMRSRTNAALGLTSQGFRDTCEVPVRD